MKDSIVIGHMLRLKGGNEAIDPAAMAAARANSGSARDKLYAYMMAHDDAGAFKTAWAWVSRAARWSFWAAGIIAIALGALAATSAFGQASGPALGVRQVNVFWLLVSLLGVHCVTLLLWAAAMLRPGSDRFSLLALVHKALAFLMRRSPKNRLAALCFAETHLKRPIGPWFMSITSHGFWALYLAAGCIAASLLLSIQSYTFIWETTLLNAQVATRLVGWLAEPLGALGLPVPTAQMVAAAQNTAAQPAAGQGANIWAQFCLAAVLVYGVAPRAILWALCFARFKALKSQYALDPAQPFFARLLAGIYQPGVQRTIVDEDEEGCQTQSRSGVQAVEKTSARPPQGAKIIGWEIDALDSQYAGDNVLGVFDHPKELEEAMAALSQSPVVLVVSALNTPDRGVERALSPFKALEQSNRSARIEGVEILRTRSSAEDVTRRIGDWWSLLTRLGFEPAAIDVEGGGR